MAYNVNGIQREIKVKGQKPGSVISFKYLGAVISDDRSKPTIKDCTNHWSSYKAEANLER